MRYQILTLTLTIVALSVALAIAVVQVRMLKDVKATVIHLPELVEIPQEPRYYSGIELNNEVGVMISNGGSDKIVEFFTERTNSTEIASIILHEAMAKEVPITAAYSLAWGESRFHPNRTNDNGVSKDWGLFQINDGYRDWSREDFLNINKNTKEGLDYFSYSLKTFDGDLVMAIAGYNKGVENVKRGDIVQHTTLVHINNITEYDRQLEADLNILVNRWNNEQ